MAGHSKWSQIKRKKALLDTKRGKEFTRLIREITIVARTGGGDPAGNARLRLLLEKAKEINMPLENSQKAIKRGTGELPGVHYEEQTYEGYGPFGMAVMIDALTDNKNRTVAEFRRIFSGAGGNLAETGSVNWMFNKMGVIRASGVTQTDDELLELLIDYDIKDITRDEDLVIFTTDPKSLDAVRKTLIAHGATIKESEIEWVATNTTTLSDDQMEKAAAFLQEIEDHDDTKFVYSNIAD